MIFKISRSIYSIFLINLKIFFNFKKQKIILFNFPREQVTKKDLFYVEDLFSNIKNNYIIIYSHKLENLEGKNKYFVLQFFLNFIFNVDYFVSTYVSDNFPSGAIKIYIHHCITDCPLTNKKKDKEIALRFSKYNYIFINSYYVKKYFQNLLKRYQKYKKNNFNVEIREIGYPRLDFLLKKSKFNIKNIKKKSIIIAPANFLAFPEFTLVKDIELIIEYLLKYSNLNIIFRPHPQNRINIIDKNGNINKNFNFIAKFKKNKRFKMDFTDNYLKNYFGSNFMITDLSGTAFTFAYLTGSPVLFYSRNENNYSRLYGNFEHYRLRKKIGLLSYNFKNFKKDLNKMLLKKNKFQKNIQNEKNRLKNLNFAKKNITNFFREKM